MRDVRGGNLSRSGRLRVTRPMVVARVRLFLFLTMLVPLFGTLQSVLEEGVPRVEVRIVPRDVTVEVPVEIVVERFIDRLVLMPVPTASLRSWTHSLWSFATWDLARLPRAGGLTASAALFRPSPVAPWSFSQPNAAVAAQIVRPGAPITRFGPPSGFPGAPNPFAPEAQLASAGALPGYVNLASVLAAPLIPLTTGTPSSASVPASLVTGPSNSATSDGLPSSGAPANGLPADVAAPGPIAVGSSVLPAGGAAEQSAEAGGPAPATGLAAPARTMPRQPLRERQETGNDNVDAEGGRAAPAPAVEVPGTGSGGSTTAPDPPAPPAPAPARPAPVPAQPVPATATPVPVATATRVPATATPVPATATRVPATATKVPATRVPATATSAPKTPTPKASPTKTTQQPAPTKTPTPKAAPTKTPTPKPAPTKTPTPKPAPTKTPTPKPKEKSEAAGKNQNQNQNQNKNQGQTNKK